ncbi:hypothetical protein NKH77_52365 [Streptomyces sp. M19]
MTGFDAEFGPQESAELPESGQGVGLTAAAVERQHEQAVQPLPERVVSDELPQLAHQV